LVQVREQNPRGVPLLSVNFTHLPSLHSLPAVQSVPSSLLPPPELPELLEVLDELVELLLLLV